MKSLFSTLSSKVKLGSCLVGLLLAACSQSPVADAAGVSADAKVAAVDERMQAAPSPAEVERMIQERRAAMRVEAERMSQADDAAFAKMTEQQQREKTERTLAQSGLKDTLLGLLRNDETLPAPCQILIMEFPEQSSTDGDGRAVMDASPLCPKPSLVKFQHQISERADLSISNLKLIDHPDGEQKWVSFRLSAAQ